MTTVTSGILLRLLVSINTFSYCLIELVRNLMAHAQKPDFVFRLNGRVHLNWRGSQFSRLLAAEVCASALVMLDTQRSEVVWEYWLPTPFASFPFTSPPVRHRVSWHSERSIQSNWFQEIQTAAKRLWPSLQMREMFLLRKPSQAMGPTQPGHGAHPASYSVGTRDLFPRG